MGPPSSGGTTVGEILNILDRTDLGGGDRATALHLFMEASALAYADRGAYLGDPAYVDVPRRRAALARVRVPAPRARRSGGDGAAPVQAGDPLPYDDAPPPVTVPTIQRTGSTTHLTVADAEGNVVSYTFTIEQIGGNAIVVPGPRVPAQQRADGLLLRRPRTRRTASRAASGRARRWRRRSSSATASRSSRSGRRAARRSSPRSPRCSTTAWGSARAAGRGRRAARVRAQHREGRRRARLHRLARGPGAGVDATATSSTRSTRSAPSPASSGWATAGCSPRRSRCAAAAGPPEW